MNVIKHRGIPKRALTPNGITVNRREHLFTNAHYGMVRCTPYGDHFIYENPDKREGTTSFLCTCGSVGVIANPYAEGNMLVCLNHASFGFHQTSQVNVKDYEKGNPVIKRGRKWA